MRSLVNGLEILQEAAYQQPAWKLFVYDIVSTRTDPTPQTIGDIVSGSAAVTAPLDLTNFVSVINRIEQSSDFVQGSLQGDSITFQVVDTRLTFDPVDGSEKRWLAPGNVVRVHEGDGRKALISNETFNGTAVGVLGTYSLAAGDVVSAETITVRSGSPAGTLLSLGVDYTVDEFAGTITGLGANWIAATDYFVTYEAHVVPVNQWPITFTGSIAGRAGAADRDRSNNAILQVSCVDRMASFLKIKTTSAAYNQGTTYQEMIRALLEDDVGMSPDEFELSNVGNNNLTSQATTQLVDESPVISVAKIAFVDGFMPRFNGAGVMTLESTVTTRGAAIFYADQNLFAGFSRPFSPVDGPNEVEVLGLSANQTQVKQPRQVLATASLTLGFFGGDASIRVQFSDDATQQAIHLDPFDQSVDSQRTQLNVVSSVTGALIPFGSEEYEPDVDADGGVRSGRINVEGAFYAPLVTVLFASRIAASFIPDSFAGFGGGSTIPIGRIVEGTVSVATSLVQATIGRGDYEITGVPYEYVFREIRRVARVADVPIAERRTITIENHLLDNDDFDEDTMTGTDEVQEVANRELVTARKRENTYTISMRHDLRLEPYDKFQLPDGRSFIIVSINRSLTRDENNLATLQVFETTAGVFP